MGIQAYITIVLPEHEKLHIYLTVIGVLMANSMGISLVDSSIIPTNMKMIMTKILPHIFLIQKIANTQRYSYHE